MEPPSLSTIKRSREDADDVRSGPSKRQKSEALTVASRAGTTARNRKVFPLLRLPAEIRNLIYAHALGGRILVHRVHALKHPDFSIYTLPLVSRQIHSETWLLIYRLNTFHIHSISKLGNLLNTLSAKEIDAISSLKLSLDLMTALDCMSHPEQDNLYTQYIAQIGRLKGLRRVVLMGVNEKPRNFVPVMDDASRRARGKDGVRKCAGRDIDVTYE